MAIQDKATLDGLITSLFPTGTGNIAASERSAHADEQRRQTDRDALNQYGLVITT